MERKISIGEADKLYLAGKITGDSEYRERFGTVMKHLTWAGWKVMNPAILPEGFDPGDYMRICFSMIDSVDAVVFLEGWEKSRGAMLERLYCDYIGKPCYRYVSVAPGTMELQNCEDPTFGDAIRAMDDEELADFLLKLEVGKDTPWGKAFYKKFCDSCSPVREIRDGKWITTFLCKVEGGECPHGDNDILWWLKQSIRKMTAEVGNNE